jgi:PiT family inorganic phosphate transporter
MELKINKLTYLQIFCSHAGTATGLAIPVSETRINDETIAGIGASRHRSGMRRNIVKDIVIAWVLTMPIAGLIEALAATRPFG